MILGRKIQSLNYKFINYLEEYSLSYRVALMCPLGLAMFLMCPSKSVVLSSKTQSKNQRGSGSSRSAFTWQKHTCANCWQNHDGMICFSQAGIEKASVFQVFRVMLEKIGAVGPVIIGQISFSDRYKDLPHCKLWQMTFSWGIDNWCPPPWRNGPHQDLKYTTQNCLYVCMHVRTYVHMSVYELVCMYVWMYVCMYVCMNVWMYECMNVCM